MKNILLVLYLVLFFSAAVYPQNATEMKAIHFKGSDDVRSIDNGFKIPCELYCDQPYIVVLRDGTWVCTLTTGSGLEGAKGQHIVAARSTDQGKTWSKLIDIEPAGEISASWVVPLLTPDGRIYAFYTYNGDKVKLGRDDTHGWYAYRYSDDGGLTWSERYRIPLRKTACDTLLKDGHIVQMFWGICKPRIRGNDVYIPFTKLGKYFLEEGEGWIFHSPNILTEKTPEKIQWKLLPEGEHGIRNPAFGSVQEEHNLVPLDKEGTLMCVERTTKGFPAISYSSDSGKHWTLPEPMQYANGRIIRHPRACPMLWKTAAGKYLFWFHNNGGKSFEYRNPVWFSAGLEKDGKILWSLPEIVIFADNAELRMSYPDLIHIDGKYWVSETQKEIARIHQIDAALLDGMWKRLRSEIDNREINGKQIPPVKDELVLETKERQTAFPVNAKDVLQQKGFSLEFVITVPENGIKPETPLIDNRNTEEKGFAVVAGKDGSFRLEINGNSKEKPDKIHWISDTKILTSGKHYITLTVDAAPKIVSAIADGQFVDGNGERVFGWNRYINPPDILDGSGIIVLSPEVEVLRFYSRPLKSFEASYYPQSAEITGNSPSTITLQ